MNRLPVLLLLFSLGLSPACGGTDGSLDPDGTTGQDASATQPDSTLGESMCQPASASPI